MQRDLLEKLDRALNLIEDVDKGMYEGWRPKASGSKRKHNNGFSIQTPFDQDYEVADLQNREDAEHAQRLGDDDDRYDGRGTFNGREVVRSWEEEQDEGESPHTRHKSRTRARRRDDDDDEEEELRRARDEEEDDDDEEEDDDERKARYDEPDPDDDEYEDDEDDDDEDKEKALDDDDDDEDDDDEDEGADKSRYDEEDEIEEDDDDKARKPRRAAEPKSKLRAETRLKGGRHKDFCKCLRCLRRKADKWDKARLAARKSTNKSFTMADIYETQNKSLKQMTSVRKALSAMREAVLEMNDVTDGLSDQLFELREDMNSFMASPARKSRVSNQERPSRQDPAWDRRQDLELLSKSMEKLDPNSTDAQILLKDIASIELGYANELSPLARQLLKQNR